MDNWKLLRSHAWPETYYIWHIDCSDSVGYYEKKDSCRSCGKKVPEHIRIQAKLIHFERWNYL